MTHKTDTYNLAAVAREDCGVDGGCVVEWGGQLLL